MAGRVLIVDPVVTTRIVLKVKLAAAYFQVIDASSFEEALAAVEDDMPDVILCEYTLPGGGALKLQRRLSHLGIPVIALLPEGAESARAKALADGLGDVISRPYDDRTLLARLRNILRARTLRDELRLRHDTSHALGFAERAEAFAPKCRIGLMAETASEGIAWKQALAEVMPHEATVLSPAELLTPNAHSKTKSAAPAATVARGASEYDALLVGVSGPSAQQRLDFVSALRARPDTRNTAILAVSPPETAHLAITALDTGAGDVMGAGFEPNEAAQRLGRLIKRRREAQALRRSLRAGLEAAVTDQLTGLYNRRYAIPYLDRMARAARRARRCFALMLLDLDHFKRINDTYGHGTGDAVLREFGARLRTNLRSVDLLARIGGEEFLVAMPDTTLDQASAAAKRLCELTRSTPFATENVPGGIPVSVSVGLVLGGHGGFVEDAQHTTNIPKLLELADHALYDAKAAGRDKVRVCRSAA